MYDINLIRESVVPARKKNVMFSVVSFSALLCVLTILAVIFFSTANFRMIDVYAGEIGRLKADLSELYPGTPTQEELSTIMDRVSPDLSDIGAIVDTRSRLTPVWGAVARAVPENAWVTHVIISAPKKGRDAQGATGSRSFVVGGCALSTAGTTRDEVIQEFQDNLKADPALKNRVTEVRFAETDVHDIDGHEAIGFEIKGSLK